MEKLKPLYFLSFVIIQILSIVIFEKTNLNKNWLKNCMWFLSSFIYYLSAYLNATEKVLTALL